jgi:hypothetical protein
VVSQWSDWLCSEPRLSFSMTVVLRYRIHLESRKPAPGKINLRLGAVWRLAYEVSSTLLDSWFRSGSKNSRVSAPDLHHCVPGFRPIHLGRIASEMLLEVPPSGGGL